DAAQALDMVGRPVRQIEQRALAHALAVPITLAQQDGGRRIPVGDGFDIHGESIAQHRHEINENLPVYMATLRCQFPGRCTKNQTLNVFRSKKLRLGLGLASVSAQAMPFSSWDVNGDSIVSKVRYGCGL